MRPLEPVSALRAARLGLGLNQTELAERCGVSRQALGAIEAGRAQPSVDLALRLAAELATTVEALFARGPRGQRLRCAAWLGLAESGPGLGRVALAQVAGRTVAYPLVGAGAWRAADGMAVAVERGVAVVEPFDDASPVRRRVVAVGCAAALGLLTERLNHKGSGANYGWLPAANAQALAALRSRQAHVVGVHLVDPETGQPDLTELAAIGREQPLVVVTLAKWQLGLVVRRGNPKGVRGVADLVRGDVRSVSRAPGSGARQLLERLLVRAGLAAVAAEGDLVAPGHLEVASAVAMAAADVGVATLDAALVYGLDFVALAEERYDLVVPQGGLDEPGVARLFDEMSAVGFRRELSSLGYDMSPCAAPVSLA